MKRKKPNYDKPVNEIYSKFYYEIQRPKIQLLIQAFFYVAAPRNEHRGGSGSYLQLLKVYKSK